MNTYPLFDFQLSLEEYSLLESVLWLSDDQKLYYSNWKNKNLCVTIYIYIYYSLIQLLENSLIKECLEDDECNLYSSNLNSLKYEFYATKYKSECLI